MGSAGAARQPSQCASAGGGSGGGSGGRAGAGPMPHAPCPMPQAAKPQRPGGPNTRDRSPSASRSQQPATTR